MRCKNIEFLIKNNLFSISSRAKVTNTWNFSLIYQNNIIQNDIINLIIFQQFEDEVKKIDEEEAPSDKDIENTDSVIREIDDKLSQIRK